MNKIINSLTSRSGSGKTTLLLIWLNILRDKAAKSYFECHKHVNDGEAVNGTSGVFENPDKPHIFKHKSANFYLECGAAAGLKPIFKADF
jgi:energy-coupling factor transporter ATP-binding protein EcfA2